MTRDQETLFPWFPEGFNLHSGERAHWKIECDALTERDWATLARIVAERIAFGAVEGVPRGGIPFADALAPLATSGPLLIADDVWTTGNSMEEHRAGRDAIGVVAFVRRGPLAPWVHGIFTAWQT